MPQNTWPFIHLNSFRYGQTPDYCQTNAGQTPDKCRTNQAKTTGQPINQSNSMSSENSGSTELNHSWQCQAKGECPWEWVSTIFIRVSHRDLISVGVLSIPVQFREILRNKQGYQICKFLSSLLQVEILYLQRILMCQSFLNLQVWLLCMLWHMF